MKFKNLNSPFTDNAMTAVIHVTKALCDLSKNAIVRNLLSYVVEDFANETLDENATARNFDGFNIAPLKTELFAIRETLDLIMYSLNELPRLWWFNNMYRVEKLVLVSMCLERANYLSFTNDEKNPTLLDLPSCIAFLTCHIRRLKQEGFDDLKAEHFRIVQNDPYFALYVNGPSTPITTK